MNETERQTLADTIDLTVTLVARFSEQQRRTKALESLLCRIPEIQKAYQTEFAKADDRGEYQYENLLAAAQRLAAARDRLRTVGKVG